MFYMWLATDIHFAMVCSQIDDVAANQYLSEESVTHLTTAWMTEHLTEPDFWSRWHVAWHIHFDKKSGSDKIINVWSHYAKAGGN